MNLCILYPLVVFANLPQNEWVWVYEPTETNVLTFPFMELVQLPLCQPGFVRAVDGQCALVAGQGQEVVLRDIDECSIHCLDTLNTCCINLIGSYVCLHPCKESIHCDCENCPFQCAALCTKNGLFSRTCLELQQSNNGTGVPVTCFHKPKQMEC